VCSQKSLAHQAPPLDCVVMDKGGVISLSGLASLLVLVVKDDGEDGDIRLTGLVNLRSGRLVLVHHRS
jgi:hypothetical protein